MPSSKPARPTKKNGKRFNSPQPFPSIAFSFIRSIHSILFYPPLFSIAISSKPKGVRRGYMGHITSMSTSIINLASVSPSVEKLLSGNYSYILSSCLFIYLSLLPIDLPIYWTINLINLSFALVLFHSLEHEEWNNYVRGALSATKERESRTLGGYIASGGKKPNPHIYLSSF